MQSNRLTTSRVLLVGGLEHEFQLEQHQEIRTDVDCLPLPTAVREPVHGIQIRLF